MAKYKLTIVDQETGKVIHEQFTDVAIFSVLCTDDNGDSCIGNGTVCYASKVELLSLHLDAVRYHESEARMLVHRLNDGESQ